MFEKGNYTLFVRILGDTKLLRFLNRNFLVGSGRHLAEDPTHNLSECFPNGRLLTVMVATWNTGEQSKLYDQNFTPTARDMAKEKEMLLNDMSDILLPTFIEYVSDVIIICTQEMSATKNKYRLSKIFIDKY